MHLYYLSDEQRMTAAKERGHEIVDDLVLADDAPSDLLHERAPRARELIEQLEIARVVRRLDLRGHAPSSTLRSPEANARRSINVRADASQEASALIRNRT